MKKTGWALYPKSTLNNKNQAFNWLEEEARKYDIDLQVFFFEDILIPAGTKDACLCAGKLRQLPDFVLMRGYESIISVYFEMRGIPVFNTNESMVISRNKMLSHLHLSCADIPTPHTVYLSGAAYDYEHLCSLFGNKKFIIKNIEGSKGENVYLVNSGVEMKEVLEKEGERWLAQEYIETSRGKDIRVWVIGGEIAASVMRHSDTSFKSNYSLGGRVAPFEMNREVGDIAVRAARAIGLDFAGVDILFAGSSYAVCEINGNAGFRTLSCLPQKTNLPAHLFRYIHAVITKC